MGSSDHAVKSLHGFPMQLDLREMAVKTVRGSLLPSGPCYDLDLWD